MTIRSLLRKCAGLCIRNQSIWFEWHFDLCDVPANHQFNQFEREFLSNASSNGRATDTILGYSFAFRERDVKAGRDREKWTHRIYIIYVVTQNAVIQWNHQCSRPTAVDTESFKIECVEKAGGKAYWWQKPLNKYEKC